MMHVSPSNDPFSYPLPAPPAAGFGVAQTTWSSGPFVRPATSRTPSHGTTSDIVAAVDPDEDEEDLGDEEDLSVAQPTADDESNFDDFDDEFDDDFEEEENDPDWDHPDDGDAEPPPGKAPGRKK